MPRASEQRRSDRAHPLRAGELSETLRSAAEECRRIVRELTLSDSLLSEARNILPELIGVEKAKLDNVRFFDQPSAGVSLRLVTGEGSIELTIVLRDPSRNAFLHTAHFSLRHTAAALSDSERIALEAVRQRLRGLDGPDGTHPTALALAGLLSGLGTRPAPGVASRLPDARELGQEADTITRFVREYRSYFGVPPACYRRELEGAPLFSLEFAREELPEDNSFFCVPPKLRDGSGALRYLAELGFGCDELGRVRIVPLPASYRLVHAKRRLDAFGLTPQLAPRATMALFTATWISGLQLGKLAINLGSRSYYTIRRALDASIRRGSRRARRDWLAHFTTLAHDMSVHVLSAHLVPRELLLRIGDRVESKLSARLAARLLPPRPIVDFYDTDLFLHCRSIWSEISALEQFAPLLVSESSLEELLARLEQRLSRVA